MDLVNKWNSINMKKGLWKEWVYTLEALGFDYLQKAANSCADFEELKGKIKTREDVIAIIVYMDWVITSFDEYLKTLRKDVVTGYEFSNEAEFENAKHYMKALRSFVVAHPLATDRHPKYGFDGDLICADIYINKPAVLGLKNYYIGHIDFDGIKPLTSDDTEKYFYIGVYSKERDSGNSLYDMSFSLKDVERVFELTVDNFNKLNQYLSKLKKEDF